MKMLLFAVLLANHLSAATVQIRNLTASPATVPGQAVTLTFEVLGQPGQPTQWVACWSIDSISDGSDSWVATSAGIYPSTMTTPTTGSCPMFGQNGPTMGVTPAWTTVTAVTAVPASWPACWGARRLIVQVSDFSFNSCGGSDATMLPMDGCTVATPTATPTTGVIALAAAASCPVANIVDAVPVPNPNPTQVKVLLCGTAETLRVDVYTVAMVKIGRAETTLQGPGWVTMGLPPDWFPPCNSLFFGRVSTWAGGRETSHRIVKLMVSK